VVDRSIYQFRRFPRGAPCLIQVLSTTLTARKQGVLIGLGVFARTTGLLLVQLFDSLRRLLGCSLNLGVGLENIEGRAVEAKKRRQER
jgi:hypothetical protein